MCKVELKHEVCNLFYFVLSFICFVCPSRSPHVINSPLTSHVVSCYDARVSLLSLLILIAALLDVLPRPSFLTIVEMILYPLYYSHLQYMP